jgi:hypothetical protein
MNNHANREKISLCRSFIFKKLFEKRMKFTTNNKLNSLAKTFAGIHRKRLGFKSGLKAGEEISKMDIVNFKHNKEVFDISYMKNLTNVFIYNNSWKHKIIIKKRLKLWIKKYFLRTRSKQGIPVEYQGSEELQEMRKSGKC